MKPGLDALWKTFNRCSSNTIVCGATPCSRTKKNTSRLHPPPGFFPGLISPPRIAGSISEASGVSTPHLTHMLLHSAPTGRSSGMNTTVLTYVMLLFRQLSELNSCASQWSSLPAKNTPQRACDGRLMQAPSFQFAAGGANCILWIIVPRQCLGPPEPENDMARIGIWAAFGGAGLGGAGAAEGVLISWLLELGLGVGVWSNPMRPSWVIVIAMDVVADGVYATDAVPVPFKMSPRSKSVPLMRAFACISRSYSPYFAFWASDTAIIFGSGAWISSAVARRSAVMRIRVTDERRSVSRRGIAIGVIVCAGSKIIDELALPLGRGRLVCMYWMGSPLRSHMSQ